MAASGIRAFNERIVLIYVRDEPLAADLRASIQGHPNTRCSLRAAKFYEDEQEMCHEVVIMWDVVKFYPQVAERIQYIYSIPRSVAPKGTPVRITEEPAAATPPLTSATPVEGLAAGTSAPIRARNTSGQTPPPNAG